LVSFALCAVLVAACGSDNKTNDFGGAHKCGEVAPCGGDVVGSWTVADSCIGVPQEDTDQLDALKQQCPQLTYRTSSDAAGIALFTADTYAFGFAATATIKLRFPASCIGGLGCAAAGQLLGSYLAAAGSSLTCTGSGNCDCTVTATVPYADSGTYTKSGTTLTLTGAGGTSPLPYCVEGSTLHVITLDGTAMNNVVADIVGTK
jgi:hypothetical protein